MEKLLLLHFLILLFCAVRSLSVSIAIEVAKGRTIGEYEFIDFVDRSGCSATVVRWIRDPCVAGSNPAAPATSLFCGENLKVVIW